MFNNWEKLFELIKKTGDRLVVVDKTGKDIFVVMDINKYQELLNDKQDFCDDYYNEEMWSEDFSDKEVQEPFPSTEELNDLLAEQDDKGNKPVDDYYYIEPVN